MTDSFTRLFREHWYLCVMSVVCVVVGVGRAGRDTTLDLLSSLCLVASLRGVDPS